MDDKGDAVDVCAMGVLVIIAVDIEFDVIVVVEVVDAVVKAVDAVVADAVVEVVEGVVVVDVKMVSTQRTRFKELWQ